MDTKQKQLSCIGGRLNLSQLVAGDGIAEVGRCWQRLKKLWSPDEGRAKVHEVLKHCGWHIQQGTLQIICYQAAVLYVCNGVIMITYTPSCIHVYIHS